MSRMSTTPAFAFTTKRRCDSGSCATISAALWANTPVRYVPRTSSEIRPLAAAVIGLTGNTSAADKTMETSGGEILRMVNIGRN